MRNLSLRWVLPLVFLALSMSVAGCGSTAGGSGDTEMADLTPGKELASDAAVPDTAADLAGDLVAVDTVVGPACGDGVCDAGEECLHCPADCDCSCGDGVCTHGEFCVVCPADCDCTDSAATPPMGWNSWNLFACDIDETLAQETAQAMVDNGMAAAGYRYVNLDDCWQVDRTEAGVIVEDPVNFASGMGALATHVHDLGLKFGVYTCAGPLTCQKRPASYQFEEQDAATYAEWGVDYVKVDWCSAEEMNAKERFGIFRDAIAATGREILLSICNWGEQDPWIWGPTTGALWRTSGDIFDHPIGMNINLNMVIPLAAFARPGHWNDPDMLEVGNGGMSFELYKAHFSLWAILAAPLLAGNDVRNMDAETSEILLNSEVIAVDQDPAGLQGVLLEKQGMVQVFAKPLTMDGWRTVVFYNTDLSNEQKATVSWSNLGLAGGKATVRDLWKHQDLGEYTTKFEATIPASGAVMVRIAGTEILPKGTVSLADHKWKYMTGYNVPVRKNTNSDKGPIVLEGKTYDKGLGISGAARVVYQLGSKCTRFTATLGLDDTAGAAGSVTFEVRVDGKQVFDSGIMTKHSAPMPVDVDLTHGREIELLVTPASDSVDGDLADWGDAIITCK